MKMASLFETSKPFWRTQYDNILGKSKTEITTWQPATCFHTNPKIDKLAVAELRSPQIL